MALHSLVPGGRGRRGSWTAPELSPWRALQQMERLLNEVVQGFDLGEWPYLPGEPAAGFRPRMDIEETESEIRVTAEVPGLETKDFEISVSGDRLTLKGEKREERASESNPLHRLERSYGAFQRTLVLPCEVETDEVEASYRGGILTILLPKAASARSEARRIEVKTS